MLKYTGCFLALLFIFSCTKSTSEFNAASKIEALQKKASGTQNDSSYIYLKKAEKILLKNSQLDLDSLTTENYFALGEYFSKIKQNDSSIYYKFKGIQSIDSISNQREITFFYNTWYQLIDLSKYGDCTILANEFEKKIAANNYNLRSLVYYFRENIAKYEHDYSLAVKHNKQRVYFLKKLKDTKLVVPGLISRANNFYYLNESQQTYQILDSLIVQEATLNNDLRRQLYGEYAVYTFYDSDFDKSLYFNLKVLENVKKDDAPLFEKNNSLAIAYSNISEIYIELKQFRLAQKYIDSVNNIGFKNIGQSTQRNLLKYQLRLQSLTKTNEKKVTKLLDSIFNYQDISYKEKYNQELIALKIETQKKEQLLTAQQAVEIKNINLKNRLTVVIVSSFLFLLIGLLYFFLRKSRQEKKVLYMQQRLLRTQMSPHFIFNTLSSIHNIMSSNSEKASKYLVKFSRLLRLVLENSLENYVALEDELETIEKFLELQLLRFPNKFEYSISLENLNSNSQYSIPPMLLQPFIENAILHGFKGIDYLGCITIVISEKNKYLECLIEDNGIGITNIQNSIKKSVSVRLISDFLEKTTQSKIVILSKKTQNPKESGLSVSFLIPYKRND